jgi:hypothetical protein
VARTGGRSGAVAPVLSALVLETRLAAESSICCVVSTLPVTGRPWPRWRGTLPPGNRPSRAAACGRRAGMRPLPGVAGCLVAPGLSGGRDPS